MFIATIEVKKHAFINVTQDNYNTNIPLPWGGGALIERGYVYATKSR